MCSNSPRVSVDISSSGDPICVLEPKHYFRQDCQDRLPVEERQRREDIKNKLQEQVELWLNEEQYCKFAVVLGT